MCAHGRSQIQIRNIWIRPVFELPINMWTAAWQNQQNDLRAKQRLRSAWTSESLLSAWRSLASLAILRVHRDDSDQTGWMPRLIWVFSGHTGLIAGFVMRHLIYEMSSICFWAPRHISILNSIFSYMPLPTYFVKIWNIDYSYVQQEKLK